MGNHSNERTIIIYCEELYHMLLSKIYLMLLAVAVGAGAGALYSQTSSPVPMYKATTKMYVTGMESNVPTAAGFSLGQQVIGNYLEIIKSRPVMEQVIQEMELNMTYQQLLDCLSYYTPEETNMLELTIKFPDPEWAKAIADRLAELSADRAELIMGSSHPRIYEEAYVPELPYNLSSMYPIRYIILGGLAAGMMAVCSILAAYFFKNRFHNPDQVEETLGLSVLTMLPKTHKKSKGAEHDHLQQAYQNFYSRLYHLGKEKKVFALLSVLPHKGQEANVILGLAAYLTSLGKRVICIDGNMFHPQWGISASSEEKGLSQCLSGQASLEDVIVKKDGQETLVDCVHSGAQMVNSLELLADPFKELIWQCKQTYDYILIDTPPGDYIPDTQVICEAADAMIWLISFLHTPVRDAKRLAQRLTLQQGQPMAGAVLYDVDPKKNRGYLQTAYGAFWGNYQKGKGKKNG